MEQAHLGEFEFGTDAWNMPIWMNFNSEQAHGTGTWSNAHTSSSTTASLGLRGAMAGTLCGVVSMEGMECK